MAAILESVGAIVTAALGWCTQTANFVTSTPIALLFCGISLVGLGVGLFKRILN